MSDHYGDKHNELIEEIARLRAANSEQQRQLAAARIQLHGIEEIEAEREMTLALLEAFNRPNQLHELMQTVTSLMRSWSQCEAVGIRLREGDDYPYFETRGFAPEFVRAESRLCEIDILGCPVCDSQGNPVLECMCGNVIRGRFDPSRPFFTTFGSFWTNSTSELLTTTSEADRQARTRNRCNGEGYESVALIPLRHGSETFGLLQFNDPRPNCFSVAKIAFLERLSTNLAMALNERRSARALRKSEAQHHAILQTAMDGFMQVDLQGRLTKVNHAYSRMSGFSESELLGFTITDLEIVETREQSLLHIQNIQDWGQDRFESRHRHKDGHIIEVEVSAQFFRGGIIAFVRDITARKQAEAELERNRQQLSSAIETARLGPWEYDAIADTFTFNDHFYKIFGTTAEAQGGYTMSSAEYARRFFFPEDRKLVGDEVRKALEAAGADFSRQFEHRIRYADGRSGTISVRFFVIKDDQGRTVKTYGVNQDVTELRQMEARVQQAQRIEAIGALAGGIAHDFNNILFPIMGLSEILLEDLPAGSLERDNVAEIYTAARRAGELVHQILSFSRQAEPQKTPLKIQKVVKEALKLIRATIPSDIEIRQSIQADCGPVLADPTNLHQIVMNLVTNAYHAVEQNGGIIEIGLRQCDLGEREVIGTSLMAGTYAELSVADTGQGIADEVLDKIFEPYFTTKPKGKGTGLGLSVVYGHVKDHGGDIRVASQVGQGTTFRVYLPLLKRNEEAIVPEKVVIHATGMERILLVDDEEAIIRLEKQILERLGYRVTSRTSSIEALELFRVDPTAFDLVITDMTMPHMTGDQLARQFTMMRSDVPVIILTGFSERLDDRRTELADIIKGVLLKPVVTADLAALVRNVLDRADAPKNRP